jgi:hypothetical protein
MVDAGLVFSKHLATAFVDTLGCHFAILAVNCVISSLWSVNSVRWNVKLVVVMTDDGNVWKKVEAGAWLTLADHLHLHKPILTPPIFIITAQHSTNQSVCS